MIFSHFKNKKISMVDISKKKVTKRTAKAKCFVIFKKSSFQKIIERGSPKGEIFNTAKCAGILAAKKTSELIPLSHNINLSNIDIEFIINKKDYIIEIYSTVSTSDKTGVEIEALIACSISAITIYDMCKSIDKSITVENLKLTSKTGGKSGNYKND